MAMHVQPENQPLSNSTAESARAMVSDCFIRQNEVILHIWIGRTLTLISHLCRGDVGTELSIPLYLRPTISPKIWPIQGKMPPSLARSIMPLVAVSWYSFHESKVRKGATHEQD